MLVSAKFNHSKPSPFCTGKIEYGDSNSKTVTVSFETNGHMVNGDVMDKNNNHCFKVSFTENNKTQDVLFKIPINKISNKLFITSAIIHAYLNIINNVDIEANQITINITEVNSVNDEQEVCFGAKMLERIDDAELIFDVEEQNINSIQRNTEIINNDMHNNNTNRCLQCLTDCWNKITSICGN